MQQAEAFNTKQVYMLHSTFAQHGVLNENINLTRILKLTRRFFNGDILLSCKNLFEHV